MKAYEDTLYEQWKENVEHILPNLLRHNLLTKPVRETAAEGQITGIQHEGVPLEEDDGEAVSLQSLYSLFTVSLQSLYSLFTVSLQSLYSLFTVSLQSLQSLYSLSTVSLQSLYSLSTVSLQSLYSLFTVSLQSLYSLFTVSLQSLYSLFTVSLQSLYSLFTVSLQSLYSLFTSLNHQSLTRVHNTQNALTCHIINDHTHTDQLCVLLFLLNEV